MTLYTFAGYKRSAELIFTCPSCGKPKRKRVFTVEHTVNPYNKNADGTVKTAAQVAADSAAEARRRRDEFAIHPLCATCEGHLSYSDLRALNTERHSRFAALPSPPSQEHDSTGGTE